MRTETLVVHIPAGVADGARIRIAGKGHVGARGGGPGDLYITVDTSSRIRASVAKETICTSTVPIAVHEAALGARIDMPTPDGPVRLRVPPGTQSGQRFRLRDRGVPSPRTASAATSSSRCGWCCRRCSTSDRRSCCASSAIAVANGDDTSAVQSVSDRGHERNAARRTT